MNTTNVGNGLDSAYVYSMGVHKISLMFMDELISIKTLSKRLDISENTIRWWIATGKVPYVKHLVGAFQCRKIQQFIVVIQ